MHRLSVLITDRQNGSGRSESKAIKRWRCHRRQMLNVLKGDSVLLNGPASGRGANRQHHQPPLKAGQIWYVLCMMRKCGSFRIVLDNRSVSHDQWKAVRRVPIQHDWQMPVYRLPSRNRVGESIWSEFTEQSKAKRVRERICEIARNRYVEEKVEYLPNKAR